MAPPRLPSVDETSKRPIQPRSGGRAATGTGASGTGATHTGATAAGSSRTGSTGTGSTSTAPIRTGPTKTRTGAPRKPPGKWWVRALRKTLFWGLLTSLVITTVVFVGSVIVYSRLPSPVPNDFAQAQALTVYYADGTHVMGRLGLANREDVDIDTLHDWVPHAVVAAEDRTFYTNPGLDLMGMTRAMVKTIVTGHRQGGSTITQQYVERYYVGRTTTDLMGKWREALLALKIDREQDKNLILENYLNTIYFGRGAYGIQAAAREYYGKPASELTLSEAAMLAGIIPAPSAWDPRNDHDQAVYRWNYVLDGMVQLGYLTAADRLRLDFPEPIPYQNEDVFAGTQGYILRAAIDEAIAEMNVSAEDIEMRGYSIITTIDWATQDAAQKAAESIPTDHSPNLHVAIVTLDPTTGAITSMYGGADYLTRQQNAVTQDIAQAGSTFKPFALVAALEGGMALESEYNGDSPKVIEGFQRPVQNFGGESFGQINLIDATAHSVNTVYAQLARDVGPENVVTAAETAGLPKDTAGLEANPANVLGTASPHPLDMAAAYATFASGGYHRDPYLVSQVLGADGLVKYLHVDQADRVFPGAVMAEVTYALQQVVNYGTGSYAHRIGRPIAGKTGTSSDNKSAWFIGFTPQVVGVVALYQVGEDGSAEDITPFGGFRQITGGTIPVQVWTTMMEPVLAGLVVEDFPPRSFIGTAIIPSPSPTPSASPSASPSPSPTPSPSGPVVSPSPTPVGPTPSPTPSA